MHQAAQRGLEAAAEHILERARAEVPVDTGELRADSGIRMEDGIATIHFDSDHAIVVHERIDLAHDDGQPHFLSDPLIKERNRAGEILAARMREAT